MLFLFLPQSITSTRLLTFPANCGSRHECELRLTMRDASPGDVGKWGEGTTSALRPAGLWVILREALGA